jgi:hypothetical protein
MDTTPPTALGVFREPFTFRNSDAAILRFPFPFREDRYRYHVNLEPHVRGGPSPAYDAVFDVDEHYAAECAERAHVLAADPGRCQVLPHMRAAEWDTLELLMQSLAADYPADFALRRDGDRWRWINRRLDLDQTFVFGDAGTLPRPPFEYITRQAQGDFTLQDQRDGTLFLDGGILTTPAGWSLDFNLGMSFHELHGPVPVAHEAGVFDGALRHLLALRHGQPARRVNWAVTVNPRLDCASETSHLWGRDAAGVTAANVGETVCLRVELQTLFRLPRGNAILFGIRCYLIRLAELVRVAKWARRLHRVLGDLDPRVAEYKGLTRLGPIMVAYLACFDDGAPTGPGSGPDQDRL